MDSFSISLTFGTLNIAKRKILLYFVLVSIFHFIMPIIGSILNYKYISYLNINNYLLLSIILFFLSIKLIIDIINNNDFNNYVSYISIFLLSISVSVDSFTTGIGIIYITNNILIASTIFSILVLFISLTGYILGKYTNSIIGIYSKLLGVFLLIILSLIYLFRAL